MFCNILFWIILPKYKKGEQLFYPFKIKYICSTLKTKSTIPTLANIVVIIGSEKDINFKIDIYGDEAVLKDATDKVKKLGYTNVSTSARKEGTEQSIIEYNKEDYFVALRVAKELGITDMIENNDLSNKIGVTIK